MNQNTTDMVKFPFRILLLPLFLVALGGTAFLEWLCETPDWKDWRLFNAAIISSPPQCMRRMF